MDWLKKAVVNKEAKPVVEDDFADFAAAPPPEPASISPVTPDPANVPGSQPTLSPPGRQVVYTKWYRIWERTEARDFYPELVILPFFVLIIILHVWGRKTNRAKAKKWIQVHGPLLQKEYAQVGLKRPDIPSGENDSEEMDGLAKVTGFDGVQNTDDLLKENTATEFITYGTGRQNVAFTDVRLTLYKRFNLATWGLEALLSYLFETIATPVEKVDITSYAFDGKETTTVPSRSAEQSEAIEAAAKGGKNSAYDAFVFAIVHKDNMKKLRDERYDLSLTATRDHDKLPVWCSVMSESAEVTDKLLTQELIKAVEAAGDDFNHLIITDQPIDKPTKLDELKPQKRLSLSTSLLPSSTSPTLPLFNLFLRLPDTLVSSAHFRPEVRRKIAATREDEQKKISKASEEEKAEERRTETEKKKKDLRDAKMRGMGAEEQRKFLEREREKEKRKMEKKGARKVQSG